jgi:hypothetical protein
MKLDKYDLNQCVRRLPKKLVELMKKEDFPWNEIIYIGGGFIRGTVAGEELNDIDLFTSSFDNAKAIAVLLSNHPTDMVKTENAFTVKAKLPIQVIHRWVFEKPEDVADSFDFTVCCAVIFYKKTIAGGVWDSYCDDRFYTDLASKRLVYRSPLRNEDAGGSMLRVLKYYQRGYRIPLDSLGAVIARLVSSIDEEKIQKGIYAAGGLEAGSREQQIAKVVTGLLREVDPNVDINHQSHLPSMEPAAVWNGGVEV